MARQPLSFQECGLVVLPGQMSTAVTTERVAPFHIT